VESNCWEKDMRHEFRFRHSAQINDPEIFFRAKFLEKFSFLSLGCINTSQLFNVLSHVASFARYTAETRHRFVGIVLSHLVALFKTDRNSLGREIIRAPMHVYIRCIAHARTRKIYVRYQRRIAFLPRRRSS